MITFGSIIENGKLLWKVDSEHVLKMLFLNKIGLTKKYKCTYVSEEK